MKTSVQQSPRSAPWRDWEQRTSGARCPGPAVLVLGKVALALLVAIPAVVALAIFFGVILMRVGRPRRPTGVPAAAGDDSGDWQGYRSRLSLSS